MEDAAVGPLKPPSMVMSNQEDPSLAKSYVKATTTIEGSRQISPFEFERSLLKACLKMELRARDVETITTGIVPNL